MIIAINLNNNFKNHTLYLVRQKQSNKPIKILKIDNLIIYLEGEYITQIIDTKSRLGDVRFQLINKLEENILLKIKNYVLEPDSKYIYGKVISKETTKHNKNLHILGVVFKEKKYQILTNRDDINLGQFIWIGLNGAVLYDGTQLKETTINNIKSDGMVLGLRSLYGLDSNELCFNKKDIDELYEGING